MTCSVWEIFDISAQRIGEVGFCAYILKYQSLGRLFKKHS